MSAPSFAVEVSQNEYLPVGARQVHAIVTVTSAAGSVADAPPAAEVIIIDRSGSMARGAKIGQARDATAAAVDVIRDGVAFAVLAGASGARPVYPKDGTMAIADARTRQAAKGSVARLDAGGGTAIGKWLLLARDVFQTREDPLRHAILLTDGLNGQFPGRLAAAISQCEGVFRCDCRGVGTDWNVNELRKISTALMGTVDIVPDPAGLTADFQAMMQASMSKEVANVALRVWTPQHATLRFIKQVAPTVEDLTARRAAAAPQAGDHPTGAWGTETRDYHLCVDVEPGAPGQEMLAARVSLVHNTASGPQTLGQGLVRALWTEDEALTTRIDRQVAHYTGQAELAQVIQDGLAACKTGDDGTAAAKLGRAVLLAHSSGNEDTARLLAKVVDVVDAATGTVRLKPTVADADEMALDTRSTKTVRVKK
ncbi:MAG TPA: VWA domain-containing protein [Streptosporangiaceae bacterium]|nr:VWA domain-containing protein [Streptosporangiaceae bacterium]